MTRSPSPSLRHSAGPRGYVGPSRRQRSAIAGGVFVLFAGVVAGLMTWAGGMPPLPIPPETALKTFDVPPPPPPPPPVPLERATVASRTAPTVPRSAGGAVGRHRQPPTPAAHDPAPTLVDRPPAPLADIEAPLPPSGRNLAAGIGTGGLDGVGSGSGTGIGQGDGQDGGKKPRVRYARAQWITPPSDRDFRREWPADAPKLTVPIDVVLRCPVKPDGHPFECHVVTESRPGLGYGAAAIRLAEGARVRPVLANGHPIDMPVIVPIKFTRR